MPWVLEGYDQAMRWTQVPAAAWRSPQELVQEGFRRSRVVMLDEAHDGLKRHHFAALVQEEAFVIDQTATVAFPGFQQQQAALAAELAPTLDRYGGTAGLLREDAGPLACWPGVDAVIVSTDNAMT
jgi:hypothetical protein